MSRIRVLFRCIGEAVYAKGLKALMSLVPFGEAIYDIAEETYVRLKRSGEPDEQRALLAAAAAATSEEARAEAEAVVAELDRAHPLPPDARCHLVSYLTQVPGAVRQTMKRPSDPAGKTVPPSFTLVQPQQVLALLPQRLPSLKAGDRLGNWELVELLGAGGFGEVWLGRHPSLHGLTAALKFCFDPAAASALRHEAALLDRVMQQGKHPGIVALRQAYLDREPLCLEYEYVNGGDLAALVAEWQRGGKVPRQQINRLVQRLAEIVAHAHHLSPPIVHRDLKPANVLVERSAENKVRLRITDFGIGGVAATQALQMTRRGATTRGQQLSTSLRGAHTPLYASPQQMRGEAPDPRDDVHALGVIWYQLLTGDLTTGIPADWYTVLRDLGQPAPLIDLLGECVASRPDKRLPSAAGLLEKLSAELDMPVLEAIPVSGPPLVALPATPTRKRPSHRETVHPQRNVAPRAPARAGYQVRHSAAPGLRLGQLRGDLEEWLRSEGFHVQDLKTDQGATLVQITQQGGWRKLIGMSTALNIILDQQGDDLTVEIGAGQWFDKAAAGVVSLFVLWPLAVTAAIGAWNQMKMPQRVFDRVSEFLARRQDRLSGPPVGVTADTIARLKELAELRDQGVLTDDEFQAQKARLLGK
jgi:serine/threonine protein kinase